MVVAWCVLDISILVWSLIWLYLERSGLCSTCSWCDSNVLLFGQDLDVQGQIRTFTRYGNGLVCAGH